MSSNVDFREVPEGVTGVDPDHPCASHLRILDASAGLIDRTRDKLAIVGYATSTRDLAPFNDPAWDIAGLNQLYRFIPRADVWMDIHCNWDEENVAGTDHRGWLRDCGIPILMTQCHDDLPTSVSYPLDAVAQKTYRYMTSSVAYYIGWAIHQGYKTIGLYGIDLVVGTEYEHQKACAEFMLGVAHGRGIDLVIPQQSALLHHTHLYGYEKEPDVGLLSISELKSRQGELEHQRDMLVAKMHGIDGALYEVLHSDQWKDDPDARQAWLTERRNETIAQAQSVDGALQENGFVSHLIELRSRGAAIAMPQRED